MWKLCLKCRNISKGQFFIFPANLLLGGFIIGIGIMNINADLFGSRILSLILSILLIPSGFFYLLSYFFGGKTCPYCGRRELIPLSSHEAREINYDGKVEYGYMVCNSCCNIGKSVDTGKHNKYGSFALILFGFLNIFYLLTIGAKSSTQYFEWLGSLIFLGVGIWGIYTNFVFKISCSQCGNKNTMIPLDTPEAQTLIKERNLTIPEEAQQQASIPKTSQ